MLAGTTRITKSGVGRRVSSVHYHGGGFLLFKKKNFFFLILIHFFFPFFVREIMNLPQTINISIMEQKFYVIQPQLMV